MLLLQRFKILGHSMEPYLQNGDNILVSGLLYLFKKPKINDIVAFSYREGVLIKRIILIKKERYFLQGDNKNDSLDSRKIGLVSRKQILGKVIHKL